MNLRAFIAICALSIVNHAALAQSAASSTPVALKGYDPVSYFNPGKPTQGTLASYVDFDDSRFLFSNQRNRELFASNPDKYSPQFSGLCASGIALGEKVQADPAVFKIIDGKLYVFSSKNAMEYAMKDPTILKKARSAWAKAHKK